MASLSKVNTLVIDDNAHMISIVRSMLLGFGITKTYESRDAAEAFDIVRHEPIDLIIVDFQMPILDGLEFTQMVRNGGDIRNPYIPIILLTAHTERSRILAARDAGVTEICAKPVTAHQMWTKLAAVVNKPRPFVRCKGYFGPDRRRQELDFKGENRRAPSVDAQSKTADETEQTDTAA
jgi:two-component system chemotaxis response regulator CheY